MKIYVGNLAFEVNEEDLLGAFGQYGKVQSAQVVTDRYSGRSRGFGFVEMITDSEAKAAIEGLNGKEIKGRAVVVNEARPRTDAPRRTGSFGGGSGGGGDRDRRGGGGGGDRRGGGGGGRW